MTRSLKKKALFNPPSKKDGGGCLSPQDAYRTCNEKFGGHIWKYPSKENDPFELVHVNATIVFLGDAVNLTCNNEVDIEIQTLSRATEHVISPDMELLCFTIVDSTFRATQLRTESSLVLKQTAISAIATYAMKSKFSSELGEECTAQSVATCCARMSLLGGTTNNPCCRYCKVKNKEEKRPSLFQGETYLRHVCSVIKDHLGGGGGMLYYSQYETLFER